jgi:hypothetical protein
MKQIFSVILGSLLLITDVGCKKHQDSGYAATADYLVVGRVGGFIAQPTKVFYLVTSTEFRKDTAVVTPPTDSAGFNFNTLFSAADLNTVTNIRSQIPAELVASGGGNVGSALPDAGYLEVIASIKGTTYTWYFQADISHTSTAVQSFAAGAEKVCDY